MYSPSRKVRASIRRTIFLTITSCLSCLILVETIIELSNNIENQLSPTRSAGVMLNRSQMLLAKEVLLEPSLFTCTKTNNYSSKINSFVTYPLYIIVKTRAVTSGNYFQRRMFTRRSWGREARSFGIPVIYAVGRANDEHTQKMLEHENKIYNDILQFNYIGIENTIKKRKISYFLFVDAYYNISIKTVGILNWFVTRGCHKNSPYLFVVDDDTLINIQSLLKMISQNFFQSNTLYGLYLKDIEPHPSGKWAVSLEDYPNRTYPPFIIGASTLYPSSVINSLVQRLFHMINQNQSIFFLDDVLISGIIAEQLGIKRAPMFGIEDCSYTDLLSRTIISECNNVRRTYIWSKFILSRVGQNTVEINRLIQTTTYIKWRGDFKQTRNGTAVLSTNAISMSDNSILIIIKNSYSRISLFVLSIIMLTFVFIFTCKCVCFRQSTSHKLPLNSISHKTTSTMLLTPVK
jgi:hypothetical protein